MPENSWQKLGALWCAWSHNSVTWPIQGHYHCRTCGRRYSVPWSEGRTVARSLVGETAGRRTIAESGRL